MRQKCMRWLRTVPPLAAVLGLAAMPLAGCRTDDGLMSERQPSIDPPPAATDEAGVQPEDPAIETPDHLIIVPETDPAGANTAPTDDGLSLEERDLRDGQVAGLSDESNIEAFGAVMQAASVATPIVVGEGATSTIISADSAASESGARPAGEWNAVKNGSKVTRLIAFANDKWGTSFAADLRQAFTTVVGVRYVRGGVASTITANITVVPLTGRVTRERRDTTAAILIARFPTVGQQLTVPRLLVRQDGSNKWDTREYAFTKDSRIEESACSRMKCLYRSALKVLEALNPPAHASLRSALNATARPNAHIFDGLRRVFDVRQSPVGQRELAMALAAICLPAQFRVDYSEGYASGVIDTGFAIRPGDNQFTQLAKRLLKDLLDKIVKELGDSIVKWIKAQVCRYIGFFC